MLEDQIFFKKTKQNQPPKPPLDPPPDPRNEPQKHDFRSFLVPFWSILGPFWLPKASKGMENEVPAGSWGAPGAKIDC